MAAAFLGWTQYDIADDVATVRVVGAEDWQERLALGPAADGVRAIVTDDASMFAGATIGPRDGALELTVPRFEMRLRLVPMPAPGAPVACAPTSNVGASEARCEPLPPLR